jgi:Asp-tRNA(Asn)/Glu-tRNA(Gln) amidotransferase A subunit family amidase
MGAAPASLATSAPLDDPADLEAFGRLVDLPFSAEERAQAKAELADLRGTYRQLRKAEFPFELPPSVRFDALLPGAAPTVRGGGAAFAPTTVPPPATDLDLAYAPLHILACWLRQGAVTSRKLTELSLARLQQHDPTLHCVITALRDEALATADARDAELKQGKDRGPLHGIPYGAKDLFAWPGAPTTFGAAPYRDLVWDLRATPLHKLHEAGAVLVAKLSLGALAMGDLWHGGRTRNPWNPAQGSSGSSAGSAAAVAAGLVPFALGTETLGSIVSPCRQCGVGGLRPTFGAVSRHGAMPLSWTMDKVGAIARSAHDLAFVFDAIRGADGHDPCTRDFTFGYAPERDLKGLRIGIVSANLLKRAEDQAFLTWLTAATGQAPREVTLPNAPYDAMLLMLHAEGAAAFDPLLRLGKLSELPGQQASDWPNQFRAARTIPAVEYVQASRLRSRLQADTAQQLAGLDVIVAPTHGGPSLVCTNLTGHPALVVPVGAQERDGGRPTVLQLLGQPFGEAALLATAAQWQRTTQWHQQRPPQMA